MLKVILKKIHLTHGIVIFLQVDEGEVAYEQRHVTTLGWAALDKFTFTVSSPPATLETQTLDIDISYEHGSERSSVLLKNKGRV